MPASRFAEWAGTAESRVTEVTRVTHAPNPNISAVLEVGPEVIRGGKPGGYQGYRVEHERNCANSGNPASGSGLPKKTLRDQGSSPGNPSNLETKEWPISPNPAADLAWWRHLFEERLAIRGIYRGRPLEEAEGLAFGDVILEWHLRNGTSPVPHPCAGCGEQLAADGGLLLCDGARVHLDGVHGVSCVTAYGRKWRGSAVIALGMMGIEPPRGFTR